MAGPTDIWHEPLANGLSLLAIGAPIWALHWRSVQRVAGQANEQGSAERDALMRKIYLYGVALIGALIILFQLAQVIYRLLLALMGDVTASLFTTETAHQLADCLVAGLIWAVHLLAIRDDARLEKATPKPIRQVAPPAVAQRSPATRRRRNAGRCWSCETALEQELEQVRQELEML